MNSSTIVLRISFALALLSASLILMAYAFGFIPDEEKAALSARASVAESLAVQLITATSRNDMRAVKETIRSVVARNKTVQSIALRRSSGKILIEAGDHQQHWIKPESGVSTVTHVQVPVLNGQSKWGSIEIVFLPISGNLKILGIPVVIAILIAFLGITGLAGNYYILRKSLRELDPAGVVPERVQKAFDTLAEGVLILDEREYILLTNASFSSEVGEDTKDLLGSKASALPWLNKNTMLDEYPWRVAIRDGKSVVGSPLSMRSSSGEVRNYTINATRIADREGRVTGAIVTFDDVTELELSNSELNQVVVQLKQKEAEISQKNTELYSLATRDPLTDCLNRRAFLDAFQKGIDEAVADNRSVYCMMMDLDHFKKVNDTYGHAVGDDVIVLMGNILKAACRESDITGRYGGEEFCVALFGLTEKNCLQVAERIRMAVIAKSKKIPALQGPVTTSIGIVRMTKDAMEPTSLLDRADKALYDAKTSGRNRFTRWEDLSGGKTSQAEADLLKTGQESPSPDPLQLEMATESRQPKLKRPAADHLPSQSIAAQTAPVADEQLFYDRVSQSIWRAERNNTTVASIFITITSYHRFSDVLGETAGEEMVEMVHSRVSNLMRQTDTVAIINTTDFDPAICQIATDSLVLQIADLDSPEPVTWIVQRLLDTLSESIQIGGQSINLSCNIGVSLYPGDADGAEKLLGNASAASRYAKEHNGANSYKFFSKQMNEYSHRQIVLETGLRNALKNKELTLHYQPIADLRNGKINAVEVLLRFMGADLQGVPTGMLIEIAEKSGLISKIGEFVLETAINQFHSWREAGIDLPKIAVNLSATQLSSETSTARLIEIITRSMSDPSRLQLEVTESALISNFTKAGNNLTNLQKTGIQIALDDFGTGYSSLAYLRRFRPDTIKIDRSFTQEIVDENSDVTLISSVIAMSHKMGMTVVAEGVENSLQLDRLSELQCDYIQGYLISRPMPANTASDWLRLFATQLQNSDDYLTGQLAVTA